MLNEAGFCPTIVDYQKAGWTIAQLEDLFAMAGLSPRDGLRAKMDPAPEMGLATTSDPEILAAMVAHPELVERPFVVVDAQARLCRPPERIWDMLDKP